MIDENENKFVPCLTMLEKLQKNEETSYEPYFLSLGVTHSAVITRNGELFTGGSKLDGQLGFKYVNPKSKSEISQTSIETNAKKVMNQYKDPRELRELSLALN